MKNNSRSVHMGAWSARTIHRPEGPEERYNRARVALTVLRTEVHGLVERALHNGFEPGELLGIPALRHALRQWQTATREMKLARAQLAT